MESSDSFVTIPDPLSNPPEALRGGIHTVDELLSPTNDLHDNANGVMLVNPNQHPPLRITLRNYVTSNNISSPVDVALFPNSPQIPPE